MQNVVAVFVCVFVLLSRLLQLLDLSAPHTYSPANPFRPQLTLIKKKVLYPYTVLNNNIQQVFVVVNMQSFVAVSVACLIFFFFLICYSCSICLH